MTQVSMNLLAINIFGVRITPSRKGTEGEDMNIIFTIILWFSWIAFVTTLLITTFTNFQYTDLNILDAIFLFFAILNTFLKISQKNPPKK